MRHYTNDFSKNVYAEIGRLHDINPNIQVMGDGWMKLVAQARVNVCRRMGINHPVFEEVLKSHEIGRDAKIIINH